MRHELVLARWIDIPIADPKVELAVLGSGTGWRGHRGRRGLGGRARRKRQERRGEGDACNHYYPPRKRALLVNRPTVRNLRSTNCLMRRQAAFHDIADFAH